MTESLPENAEEMVEQARDRYCLALDQMVEMMRGCPFTEPGERWGAAVGLLERWLQSETSMMLFGAAALERLSRVPVEQEVQT